MGKVFKYHGVREMHRNDDAIDAAAEEIRNIGYSVIDSGLSAEELRLIREKAETIYARALEVLDREAAR